MSGPRVFVVNCGSSSLKYALVQPRTSETVTSGTAEVDGGGHEAALGQALDDLGTGVELAAVAHRVVHGGERFASAVRIDDDVLAAIRELAALAPLHNPVNATGIEVARRALPGVPHVAVFDTAFHQTLPPSAYTYAVPREWEAEHGVRRYGFHGTSHAFVSRAAAGVLERAPEDVNVIVLHLGNGASATAVAGGRSVDTSMGLTPLEGLVMGTRSGDLDPAIIPHLARAGMAVEDIDAALNTRSGMLALAGDGDLRTVERRVREGDERAALALDVYCHRIRKHVGAYMAVLGRVDAVVFTGGVGENSATVRERSLGGLEPLGVRLDLDRNAAREPGARVISAAGSPVAVLVVPTNEELEMATEALAVVGG